MVFIMYIPNQPIKIVNTYILEDLKGNSGVYSTNWHDFAIAFLVSELGKHMLI